MLKLEQLNGKQTLVANKSYATKDLTCQAVLLMQMQLIKQIMTYKFSLLLSPSSIR